MSDRHFEFRPRKVPAGLRPRDLDRVDLPDDDAEPTPAHQQPTKTDYDERTPTDELARLKRDVVAIADWIVGCGTNSHEVVDAGAALRAVASGRPLPPHIAADLAVRASGVLSRARRKFGQRKQP